MKEWKKVKLGEIYDVHNGLSKGRQFFGTGFPFLTFSNVFNNWFLPDSLESLVQSSEKERENFSIKKGDVFITRTSETMDELGMSSVALKDYPHATYNGFTKRLRPKSDCMIPEYVGYYLRSPKFRGKFMAFSTMTTRASLANDDLLNMEIDLPPLPTQHRIASILSRYDALIENYQKQIKLLEEAAARLYKQWFVELKFPGYQNTTIVDGVPEGWEKKKIGEIIEYEIGGGWGDDNNLGKGTHPAFVIRGTDIDDLKIGKFDSLPFRYHQENNLKSRKIETNDIIFEVSGGSKTEGVAKTFLIRQNFLEQFNAPMICASFCKLIRLKDRQSAQYVYDTFKEWRISGITSQYDKRSASSIVNYRWKDFLSQQEMFIPSKEILDSYIKSSMDLHNKMTNLTIQIRHLTESRDRLLPKLMSGELEV